MHTCHKHPHTEFFTTAGINRKKKKTLDIHLHARHIYLGIKKLYVTGYPTVPSFYPTPPPTNVFKDFRGFPGISLFKHIVSLSSPYKNFEQNKKKSTYPILKFHVIWNTHFSVLNTLNPAHI